MPKKMFDHFREEEQAWRVTYRLAYGFLVILLLAMLSIALFLRSVPFWQDGSITLRLRWT